jgi:putative nucleotidyltransferase with HDIG domain
MFSPAAVGDHRSPLVTRLANGALFLGLAGCLSVAVVQAHTDHARLDGLTVVLALAALLAGISVVPAYGRASVSASFLVILLAGAFLGPASACGCALISEIGSARRGRTPRFAVAFNLLGQMAPALLEANMIRWLSFPPTDTVGFYLVVALAGVVYMIVNFAIVAPFQQLFRGEALSAQIRLFVQFGPSCALNIALAEAGSSIYLKVGLGGIIFALLAVGAFYYQAHLLDQAHKRSEQYVSLSWGVLAGLMRSLDIRDGRAARHAAAVARFARDMAESVGMNEREQELAHTAGLLHDIGTFALSDRVAERGRTLTEEDWVAIHRHPELGADMLKDLGMYGPVAEIVLAHHERIDGRGYPNQLPESEIPEIAKIISVAEVYDTLTASDTYRTRMSSFEALRELRRVAGSQLDARYVEVLAELLTGEGVEYRHADAADFDTELNMERRLNEAGAGG